MLIHLLLSFEEEVIRKRKEALKEEMELGCLQRKRNMDFLDILLLAKVRDRIWDPYLLIS